MDDKDRENTDFTAGVDVSQGGSEPEVPCPPSFNLYPDVDKEVSTEKKNEEVDSLNPNFVKTLLGNEAGSITEEEKREQEFHSWHNKIWGKTKCLVRSPFYFRHELHVVAGSFCSFHYHKHRTNRFEVESGVIRIVWALAWKVEAKVITSGMQFDVPCCIPHQFQVLVDGVVFEEYWSQKNVVLEEDDIIRLTVGGLSGLVYDNQPCVINEKGQYWGGGCTWRGHTPSLSESTDPESGNSD